MDIFLTGGSGYIGSEVLRALTGRGDAVRVLTRSDDSAAKVEAAGATAVHGDVGDGDLLRAEAERADGVIHTASPGDETSEATDRTAAEEDVLRRVVLAVAHVASVAEDHRQQPLAVPVHDTGHDDHAPITQCVEMRLLASALSDDPRSETLQELVERVGGRWPRR